MRTKIYILMLEGEPQYATTDLKKIRKSCKEWFTEHCNSFAVERDFHYWVEDRPYPNTESGKDKAWEDYIEETFENGEWGDYAWYECFLK